MIRMELDVDIKEDVQMEDVLERNCRNLAGVIEIMVVDLILLEEH